MRKYQIVVPFAPLTVNLDPLVNRPAIRFQEAVVNHFRHSHMLAFTFKGICPRVGARFKGLAALVAELAARPVHGPAMGALNRQKQNSSAPAACRRLFIDRTMALEAYHA
jgi:hypothetical protein